MPLAFAINLAIGLFGETWTPADWGSNIVFALAVTGATIFLGERQQRLQQSIADADLIEKIASVVGNLDRVLDSCESSALHEILLAARSGFQLVPFANRRGREDYYASLARILGEVHDFLLKSIRATTKWRETEWKLLHDAATGLQKDFDEHTPQKDTDAATALSKAITQLHNLLSANKEEVDQYGDKAFKPSGFDPRGPEADEQRDLGKPTEDIDNGNKYLPVDPHTFEASFRRGDRNQRIQARLKWSALMRMLHAGKAQVQRRRWWSETFFAKNRVYSVWWVDSAGRFSRHDEDGVEPVLINEIDQRFSALPAESQETIFEMCKWLGQRSNSKLPTAEIVTMQVGPSALLVLDGNHRLAALKYKRPRQPRISAALAEYRIVVKAGIERSLLADLKHYPRSD